MILFFILFTSSVASPSIDSGLNFTVTIEGSGAQKDLIEFIRDGKINMDLLKTKVVMVLGLTGTGKSTLVNYLNNVPLVCKRLSGKWIIDLKSENFSLPGGFAIGHNVSSKTLYPAVYSARGSHFSYIDNPGFKDTRAIEIEIANSFFREQVTHNVTELKFLLLVTHQDLNGRGQQFRESIKSMSSFLGIFDSNQNIDELSKSIGIVVTRVENDGDSDEEMINILKEKLFEILNDEKRSQVLTKNEEIVFSQIIENNQVEIFSNPKKVIDLTNEQSNKIISMINKLSYSKKEHLKIRARIDNSYIPRLLVYLKKQFQMFTENIENILKIRTSEYLNIKKSTFQFKKDYAAAYQELNELKNGGLQKKNFEDFIENINKNILDVSTRESILFSKTVIDYFIQLLPREQTEGYVQDRKWVGVDLNNHLMTILDELVVYLKNDFVNFEQFVDQLLWKYVSNYFTNQIDRLANLDDVKFLETRLDSFQLKCSDEMKFNAFVEKIEDDMMNINEKNEFINEVLNRKIPITAFIEVLPEERKLDFSFIKVWIGKFLNSKLTELKIELRNYYMTEEECKEEVGKDILCFNGYFLKLSSIMAKVKENKEIKNLKSVHIYSTHSFSFDSNYSINNDKYLDHSPDLVIITPKVNVVSPITVELSCNIFPVYPNNKVKANKSLNGLPGLNGFNGGNLIIVADNISNKNKINFVSNGGKGGLGQNGGDGAEGIKGANAEYYDVDDSLSRILYSDFLWRTQVTIKSVTYYSAEGKIGGKGFEAGRGGCGGHGGYDGVFIEEFSSINQYLIKNENFGINGNNGKPGEPGKGGFYGDTAIRGKLYFSSFLFKPDLNQVERVNIHEFRNVYNRMEASDKRGPTGSIPKELNCENRVMPTKSLQNYKNNLKSYLKFLNEVSEEFKNSKLMKRKFNEKISNLLLVS